MRNVDFFTFLLYYMYITKIKIGEVYPFCDSKTDILCA